MVTDIIPANTNSVKSLDYLAAALKDGFKAPAKKSATSSAQVSDTSKAQSTASVKNTVEEKTVEKESSKQSDDLTKIEGIGPKIAETLVAWGVGTYAELAKVDAKKIAEMIADVRGNHVPDTWPKQAKMAADGKWDELKKWQDELDGGK